MELNKTDQRYPNRCAVDVMSHLVQLPAIEFETLRDITKFRDSFDDPIFGGQTNLDDSPGGSVIDELQLPIKEIEGIRVADPSTENFDVDWNCDGGSR